MRKSARVKARDQASAPLEAAADRGHTAVVQHLIQQEGATEILAGPVGASAVRRAAFEGHLETLQELLDAGAPQEEDAHGDTPLIMATAQGHEDIVAALMSAGADPAPPNNQGIAVEQTIQENQDLVE